ncbi:alpha/beta hydrolase [Nocardia sp. NPDC052566]|uniref:alpha/beta hydrolase n=1 Tax=Nocardia sp. NPDC052566 TaxID=3364330 RepID=UPI0037C7C410
MSATAAAVLAAAACSDSGGSDDTSATSRPPATGSAPPLASIEEYNAQHIEWTPCPDQPGVECGSIRVPIDYRHPGDAAITMPLVKLAATNPEARLGVLTTNPGGPGESGIEAVLNAREDSETSLRPLRERYDLIGWDPRGIGKTAGIVCLGDKEMDDYLATDFTPSDDAGKQQVIDAHKRYGEGCQRQAGKLLGFVGTENIPKDMDVMRSALGEEKLNYIGFSYGTRIGQYYADQFPQRVGRMLLDSIDDPGENDGVADEDDEVTEFESSPAELSQEEKSVQTIFAACATGPACPVGQDPDASMARLRELVERVDAAPLPLPDGRKLGSNLALTGVFQATYDTEYWPSLDRGLADGLNGDGAELAKLADAYVKRDASGKYATAPYSFSAVQCLNGDPAKYRSKSDEQILAKLTANATKAQASSPLFGTNDVYRNAQCAFWPVPPSMKATAVKAAGAPTIVLINNTGDAATTLAAAENVARNLADAVLVVSERDDHIAYGKGSPCVDHIVTDYFLNGTVPARDTRCAPAG